MQAPLNWSLLPMCSHHLQLLMLYKRVFFLQSLLIVREVVKRAIMGLRVTMLGAEHVAALACILHCTNPLVAIPALVFVTLNKGKLVHYKKRKQLACRDKTLPKFWKPRRVSTLATYSLQLGWPVLMGLIIALARLLLLVAELELSRGYRCWVIMWQQQVIGSIKCLLTS